MKSVGCAIGIDLGTSKTCTAVFRDGNADIVPHEGDPYMPSCVAFTERCRLVGSAAKRQAGVNASNTVFSALRFVGRDFSHPDTQHLIEDQPVKVVEKSGRPVFQVEYLGKELITTPMEILAMLLARVRRDTQEYLGQGYKISGAVIVVPAMFSICQRQIVRDAAAVAKLPVIQIQSAVAMACVQYALKAWSARERKILCVDHGAGSLDVAIATVEQSAVDIIAVEGDNFLGGDDLDTRLASFLAPTVKQQAGQLSKESARSLRRLRIACEQAKCDLTSQTHVRVEVDALMDERNFVSSLTRKNLERCCGYRLALGQDLVKSILKGAKETTESIDAVIVTGGCSRIPKYIALLTEIFGERKISKWLHPHEAAARGAAFQAASVSSNISSKRLKELLLRDVAPMSIAIRYGPPGSQRETISPRNMRLPNKKRTLVPCHRNPEGKCVLTFFEREKDSIQVSCNATLGDIITLDMNNIKDSDESTKIAVVLNYNSDQSIHVSVKDEMSGEEGQTRLFDPEKLTTSELKFLVAKHELYDAIESAEQERIVVMHHTEQHVVDLLHEFTAQPETEWTLRMISMINRVLQWLYDTPDAHASTYDEASQHLRSLIRYETSTQKGHTTEPMPSPPEGAPVSIWCDRIVSPPPSPRPPRRRPSPYTASADEISHENLAQSYNTDDEYFPVHEQVDPVEDTEEPRDRPIGLANQEDDSPLLVPTATTDLGLSEISNSSTLQDTDPNIDYLFGTRKQSVNYTDSDFVQVSTYLRNTGQPIWATVPRIYTILRLLNELDVLSIFIEQGITDVWLPFTEASLPSILSPTTRARFLEQQHIAMSKSVLLENNSSRHHTHFGQGEPLPFEVVAKLGSGVHGQVDKVMSTTSFREYARKRFRRQRGTNKEAVKSFLIELQVLKRIQHRHCVELMHSYTDPKHFALLMTPAAESNLDEYYDIASNNPDKLTLLRSFFGCLANALNYLHNARIRHRDIKPQNILVKGATVYLADFGIALNWEELSRSTTTADSGKTPVYAAPEVIQFEKRNTSADVWSLGCVFMEMVTVLKGEKIQSMRSFLQMRTGTYRFYANIDNLGHWAKKIRPMGLQKDNTVFGWVRAMLDKDGEERPTAAQVYDDIVRESTQQHVPFCGSCCAEDVDSSDVEDDDDDLWKEAADLTIAPSSVQ